MHTQKNLSKLTERDEQKIAQLHEVGKSQREIAAALKCSQPAISAALKRIAERLSKSPPDKCTRPLTERLAELGADLSAAGMFAESAIVLEACAALGAVAVGRELDDTEPEPEPSDHLGRCRRLHARMLRSAGTAERMGDVRGAQRLLRDCAGIIGTIAKAERAAQDGADVTTMSKSEIDRIQAGNRDKIARMLERPLLCSECSRRLLTEEVDGKS